MTGSASRAWRIVTSRRRLFMALLCGLVIAPFVPTGSATTRWIGAWDGGVAIYIALALHLFLTQTPRHMAANAAAQEEGEWTIFGITVAVVVMSFVTIVEEFANTSSMHGGSKAIHVALVAVTLLLSWLMTQFTFAFRYAHEYYSVSGDGPAVDGGLDFPGEEHPDYMDFLYFALVLGMTFQVSDVQIKARKLRRLAALHGFLGFTFNTVILALTVNIAAGLLS
jgi:uncharacterized membrane protein